MKRMTILSALLLIFSLCIPGLLLANDENKEYTMVKVTQTLTFSLKDGQLMAQLVTYETIRCNSKTGGRYRKAVFYDDDSKINKLTVNNILAKTITTNDFPTNEIFHSDSKMAYVEHLFSTNTKDVTFMTVKSFFDFKMIDILKFQPNQYEVLESEIHIDIPDWLDCDFRKVNFDKENVVSNVEVNKSGKLHTFRYVNIPASQDLIAKPDSRKYMPHIIVLPAYFTHKGEKHSLLPDLAHLYKWYNALTKQTENNNLILKPLVETLIKDCSNNVEKIKAIFYYVQDNIKYIAFEHGIMGFKPESCQKVFNDKFGDCKGMANMTKEMLLLAGIDARLTWMGTTSVPYDYDLPSLYADNHMICTVVDGDRYIFLDATEKNNDFGHYADRIQGREVLIQDQENFIRERVPVQDHNMHEISENIYYTIESDVLRGNGSMTLRGNSKSHFTSIAQSVSEKNREETIRKYIAGQDKNVWLKIANTDLPARDQAHTIEYDLKIENQIIDDGQEKYINFEFDNTLAKFIPEKDRDIPMKINHRYFKSYSAELTIPQGYKLKYIPEKFESENVLGDFAFSYELKGDKILYHKKLHLNELELQPAHFDEWREFVTKLKAFYSEQIVLEKQ